MACSNSTENNKDPAMSGAGNSNAGSNASGGSTTTPGTGGMASMPVDGVTVSIMPPVAHVRPDGTAQFTAAVKGAKDMGVTWSVEEADGGKITDAGLYTAPAKTGTYHVVATSKEKPAAKATATVVSNTVGNCDNLPPKGKWEMIAPVTPTLGDGSGKNFAEAIIVDPFDPATVWFGTGFAGIFKSPDCGATWTKVNTGRNAAEMDQGSHISIAMDPIDRGTMYAVSLFGTHGLWKTTNGGVDWDQLFTPDTEFYKITDNFIDAVIMDPTDHLHLALGMHTGCKDPYAPTCTAETFDGGKTWKIVKLPTKGWEEGAGPAIMGAKHWTYGGSDLWLTTDGGDNWKKVTPAGTGSFNGGEVANRPIVRTSDGTYVLTSNGGFVISKDGIDWTLLPNFPKRVVSLTLAGGRLYAADQWSKQGIYTTLETDLQGWTQVPPMDGIPDDQGAPFIDYDPVHHVLYTGHFAGGMWRVVTE